jgi:hypothetical protein
MNRIALSAGLAFCVVAALGSAPVLPGHGTVTGFLDQEAAKEATAVPRISRVPAQVRKFRTAKEVTLQGKSLQVAPGRFPDTVIMTTGLAAASAQKMSGRVWAMAMRDGMAPDDVAKAGFKSPALSFSGTDAIRGATATSEVVIGGLELGGDGPALAVFSIGVYKDGALVASGRAMVDRPGTFTATTTPVDLVPGAAYHLEACLSVVTRNSAGSRGVVSDAEIREIRWSF